MFLRFTEQGAKSRNRVVRTYQETISDALEACFCFEGLRLDDFDAEAALAPGISYSEAVQAAIELEDTASRFYLDVTERSASLLATIPRAFRRAGRTRERQGAELRSLVKPGTFGSQ